MTRLVEDREGMDFKRAHRERRGELDFDIASCRIVVAAQHFASFCRVRVFDIAGVAEDRGDRLHAVRVAYIAIDAEDPADRDPLRGDGNVRDRGRVPVDRAAGHLEAQLARVGNRESRARDAVGLGVGTLVHIGLEP